MLRPLLLSRAIVVTSLTLAGCHLSQVGKSTLTPPMAVAATVAQAYTIDSSGVLQTTVRSGADVVLTGTSSENGPTNSGVPIITYTWQQASTDPAAVQVDLIKRTADTDSFTAPSVTSETQLHFQLTVTNGSGASATAAAVVTVEPIRDADHFLAFIGDDDVFTVTAATSAVVQPNAAGDTPFAVTVTKLVSFTDLNGNPRSLVPVGTPLAINSVWSHTAGSGTNCNDPQNPQLTLRVPRLNLDDQLFNSDGTPTGQRLSDLMETSDVGTAKVFAEISISSTATGVSPRLCINPQAPAAAAVAGPITVFREDLRAGAYSSSTASTGTMLPSTPSITLADTSTSSQAYYDTIDHGQQRLDLTHWLQVNGFNANVTGWNADAHAIYTNGFDLGFGRDMYLKVSNCDASGLAKIQGYQASVPILQQSPQVLPQIIGLCDVATVVVNYASLQAAVNGLNPIVAVAMEYSATSAGTPRFVKFYAYAPDTNTGAFLRVNSVDLDHRGQKNVPGACVVCHGGVPATAVQLAAAPANTYPSTGGKNAVAGGSNGDVNATFLPWDLESFFYSDTDPGFSKKAQDAAQAAEYTRANQETDFKRLNAGAYLTMTNANSDPARFNLERELIEGWYSGSGLPGTSFGNEWVPDGWKEGTNCTAGANCNLKTALPVTGSQTLYTDIFARSCRMCHIAQVPGNNIDLAGGKDHGSGSAFCTKAGAAATGFGPTGSAQYPMGCYWQFINTNHITQLLSGARMPFARRTMDRLWTDTGTWVNPIANGSSTKGAELIQHLNAQAITPAAVTPGTPDVMTVIPPGQDVLSSVPLTISDGYASDNVNAAQLIEAPAWQVFADVGAQDCTGVTSTSAGVTSVGVVGAGLIPASFSIAHAGCYLAQLNSAGTRITGASLSIPPKPPQIVSAQLPNQLKTGGSATLQAAVPNSNPLSPSALVTKGNGPFADHHWWLTSLVNFQTSGSCTTSTSCTVATPISLTETSQAVSSIAASGSFTLNIEDADGHVASATQVVYFANLSANAQQASVQTNTPNQATGITVLQNNSAVPGDTLVAQIVNVDGANPPNITGVCTSPCTLQTNTEPNGQLVMGTVTISGNTPLYSLQYSPQAAWATNPPAGEASGRSPDTFYYQIIELDGAQNVVNSTGAIAVQLKVLSRVYWNNSSVSNDVVYNVFNRTSKYPSQTVTPSNSQCAGCHLDATTNNPINFNILNATSDVIYCNLVNNPTYCATINPAGPLTPQTRALSNDTSAVFVNPADALHSVLISHPAETDGFPTKSASGGAHTGGPRCPGGFNGASPPAPNTPATCDLTNVLEWIEDGANPF